MVVRAIGDQLVKRTSIGTLVTLFAMITPISYVVLSIWQTHAATPLPVSIANAIVLVVLTIALWRAGVAVKKYVEKKDTRMDAIGAARVALGAKTCSLGGACLAGYFSAHTLIGLRHVSIALFRDHALTAGLAALSAVALIVVAMIVESWCTIPPEDDDGTNVCPTSAT